MSVFHFLLSFPEKHITIIGLILHFRTDVLKRSGVNNASMIIAVGSSAFLSSPLIKPKKIDF